MADKKLKIALCAGVAAVVILMILLLTTCSGDAAPEPTVPEQTAQATEATEATETEAPTQTPTEAPTEPTEVPTEPTEPEETQGSSGGSSTPGGYNPGFGNDDDDDDDEQETEDPFEAPAAGAKENPYVEVLTEVPSEISTVKVAAEDSVYYEIHGAANSVLTLEAQDASITYAETVCEADENGQIRLDIGGEAEPVALQITNSGSEDATYLLHFGECEGTANNPEILESIAAIAVELAEGDEDGYHYLWTVTDTCELTLEPQSEGYVIHVTYGGSTVSNAESENGALVLDVSRGEELRIQAIAVPDETGKYPQVSDTIVGTIPEKGTAKNPIELETMEPDALQLAGGTDYCRYYSWIAEMPGTFSVQVTGVEPETVVCGVTLNPKEDPDAAEDEETVETAEDTEAAEDPLTATASVEVEKGERVLIRVESAPDESGTYPEAKITFTCDFVAEPGLEANPIEIQVPEDSLSIPAGASLYYTVKASGLEMVLTGDGITVTLNETEYTPEEGKISIACGEEEFILLVITNNGEEDVVCGVTFLDPEVTEPEETEPEETDPEGTDPEETDPEETDPEETDPEETDPEETDPEETEPEETEPEETESAGTESGEAESATKS